MVKAQSMLSCRMTLFSIDTMSVDVNNVNMSLCASWRYTGE